jgi:hypothetical protein
VSDSGGVLKVSQTLLMHHEHTRRSREHVIRMWWTAFSESMEVQGSCCKQLLYWPALGCHNQ